MPEIGSAEVMKNLRSGQLSGVYYIYGKDVLTVEGVTKSVLKKRLGKDWKELYEKLDGKNIDIGALTDSMEICPMLSDFKAILINDLNAEELTADRLDELVTAINNIPDFTLLIINITGFDVKNGKRFFTGKNKKLTDCIMKKGVVCECGTRNPGALEKSVEEAVSRRGCTISRRNARMLCEYCLMDAMQISNEIEKLCAYCDGGEITAGDIDELVSGQMETDSFKLARAVISMDAERSFLLLYDLLEKRNEPVAVVSAIAMSFTDLYRAKSALTANKQSKDVTADFGYKGREFAVNNAFRDCRRISAENLRKCIYILRDADRTLKTTPFSPRTVLEKALTEMIAAVRG